MNISTRCAGLTGPLSRSTPSAASTNESGMEVSIKSSVCFSVSPNSALVSSSAYQRAKRSATYNCCSKKTELFRCERRKA